MAEVTDVDTLAELRQAWTQERRGAGPNPTFADRFRSWFAAEAHQRISPSERSVSFHRRVGFDPADTLLLRPQP